MFRALKNFLNSNSIGNKRRAASPKPENQTKNRIDNQIENQSKRSGRIASKNRTNKKAKISIQKSRKQNQLKRVSRFLGIVFTTFVLMLQLSGLGLLFTLQPAYAATTLAIEPITWDFVGLDSNKPESQGPNTYVVGARVCNLGIEDARNVSVRFIKDGVDNGYAFIRLQSGEVYTFDRVKANVPANNAVSADIYGRIKLTTGSIAGGYTFDTPANGSLLKTKYRINYTPTNCQDFYYNFEVTRTDAAWNTYQKYYLRATADNAGTVETARPRQSYIEKLISQARNEVYFFGCDALGGVAYAGPTVSVGVGDTFTCQARAHTATAYPQMSFTSDIPNVIFQVLDVQSTYSDPVGGVNSTVYADGCGWVQDPTDPRYHLSPGACSSETGFANTYSDQYPYTAPPTEGKGAVGNDITTIYKIKVIAFPNGIPNPIKVSNVILDYSGSSYHYNADYGIAPNVVNINVVTPSATDLSVVKSHVGNFNFGNNTYTLTVSDDVNSSSAKAPVILTDTLPAGYTFVDQNALLSGTQPLSGPSAVNWNCETSGQVLTCLYDTDGDGVGDNFPDGGTNALTLNVNIANGALPSGTTSTNFVRVALNTAQTDSNPANNTSSDPTTILPNADLAIVKTLADGDLTVGGNQASFVTGRQGTYNLQVTNLGNITATTPTITDTLPSELQFVSGVGTNWTCSAVGQNVTCTSSQNIAPAATTNVTLTVLVRDTSSTSTINTAIVSSPTYDAILTNNTSSVTTPITRPTPDLSITKTPSPVTLILNKNSNYTINVSNVGSDATSGTIKVDEIFPTGFGMQYIAHAGSGWSCIYSDSTPTTRPCQSGDTTNGTGTTVGTQNITFYNPGPLAAGASSAITLTVKATLDPGSTVNNTVKVSTPGDGGTGTKTAISPTNIGKPDLSIIKTHADPMTLSTNNDYTITVTNSSTAGTATTTGPISVTETFPSTGSFAYVSHSGSGWSCIFEATGTSPVSPRACLSGDTTGTASGTTRTITFYNTGPLSAGQTSSFTLTVNPGATVITAVPNTVVVSTEGEASTTLANNTYPDPTSTLAAGSSTRDIAVEKRITRVSGSPIALTDTTPTAITYVAAAPTATQCTGALPAGAGVTPFTPSGGTNPADDFSGTGTNVAAIDTATLAASRRYTCPALTAGQYVQYKIAVGSNQSSGSGKDIGISFNDAIPSILQNVSWSCSIPEPGIGGGGGPAGNNTCDTSVLTPPTYPTPEITGTTNTISLPRIGLRKRGTGNPGEIPYALITVVGRVNPSATAADLARIDNIANLGTDANLNNNSWTVQSGSGVVPTPPDLTITKTGIASINNYAQGTYTLAVATTAASTPATNRITVIDTLPTGLDFVSASGTNWTCSSAGSIITCYSDTDIPSNTTSAETIAVTVKANSVAVLPTVVINRASVSTASETILNNNNATASTTINAPVLPNLTVGKTDGGATFTQGVNGTYTITVNNTGTVATSTPITVTDTLPTGLTYFSATGTNWTCSNSGQIVICNTSQVINNGSSATPITLIVTPTIGTGTVTNNVRVDTTANAETTTADNTGSDTTPLQTNITDISIAKTARSFDGLSAVTNFQQGQQYRYRLAVTNISATVPAVAPITVTDLLPTGLTYLYSASTDGFTCSATGQTVTCDRPTNLAPSSTVSVDLVVQVGGSAPASVTNQARVTSVSDTCPDFTCTGGTKDNNRTTLNNTIGATVDLAIVKTAVDQDAVTAGNQFYQDGPAVYNITVTNNGPSNYAGSVIVNENLSAITPSDPNFTYVSHTDNTTWTCTSGGGSCVGNKNLVFTKTGGLLAGESSTIALTINVPDGVTGLKTNVASIDAATITAANDTVPGNNTENEVVDVLDNLTTLTLVKDDNDGTGEPINADLQTKFFRGGIGKYTIVATNTGGSAAKAPVTISDTLPSGLTYAGNSLTSNWQCTAGGGNSFSCIYGNWNPTFTTFTQANMPVGTTSGVEILVNVSNTATLSTLDTTPPAPDVYNAGLTTNTASISGSNFTTVNASEQTVIIEPADLAVTKAIAPSPLVASGTGTYTITVTNVASAASTGVSYPQIYLQDYLPTGLSYTLPLPTTGASVGDGWVFIGYNESAKEVTYKRTTALANGASTNITLPVTVSASPPASVTNFVRVGGFTPEPDYDLATAGYQDPRLATCDASFGASQPVNNCFALTTPISGGVSTDLKVTKIEGTDNDNPPNPAVAFNTNFPYTIRVANVGGSNAETVTLTDVLPASLEYVSHSIDAGDVTITNPFSVSPANLTRTCNYAPGTRTFSCNLLRVLTTESDADPIDITLTVRGVVSGIVDNTATVTSVTADTVTANNTESEKVLISPGGANRIEGKVFNDLSDNGLFDGLETGTANVTVRLYQDNGTTNGSFDAGDTLIATGTTNGTGDYSFTTSLTGNFVLNVNTATLPSGHVLTPTATPVTFQTAVLGTLDQNNNFGHKSTAVATDFGDAPDTYGTNLVNSGSEGIGAYHTVNTNIHLGATVPDAEADAATPLNGTGDDVTGTDDEDGVTTFAALTTSTTPYSVGVTVKNTTGGNANLVGWIDFDRDGVFQADEGASAIVANSATTATLTWSNIGTTGPNIVAGNTYARFRITTDAITTSSTGGAATNGEVEDYPLTIGAVPRLNLVKRITAINGTNITGFADGTDVLPSNDNDAKWPSPNTQYLRGAIACTAGSLCNTTIAGVKRDDTVEYTIYFLANGTDALKNVKICDRIPANTTFEQNTYATGKGILLGWDSQAVPTALPDPINSTPEVPSIKQWLTNAIADLPDKGNFVPAGTSLPNPPCGTDPNNNGGVVVDVVSGATTIPIATASGVPINSYGFVRFNVKVN